jgi:uncharacterized protein YjbI with pentapeptide repeats
MKKAKFIINNKIMKNENLSDKIKNFSFINKSKFFNCDFSKTLFKESQIFEVEFENCNLNKVNFQSCTFKDVKFINCNLDESIYNSSTFQNLEINKSSCKALQARGTLFKNTNFFQNEFYNCDLNRSIFESGKFTNLNFKKCKMFMFFCYKISMEKVNFEESNLTLAKLINCQKIDSYFNKNNKMLCFFEKNDMRFDQ